MMGLVFAEFLAKLIANQPRHSSLLLAFELHVKVLCCNWQHLVPLIPCQRWVCLQPFNKLQALSSLHIIHNANTFFLFPGLVWFRSLYKYRNIWLVLFDSRRILACT